MSMLSLVLMTPAFCWPEQQLQLWIHTVYPSQFMLTRTRALTRHLNEATGYSFSINGGHDASSLLESCSQGIPHFIIISPHKAEKIIQYCRYKVVNKTVSKVLLITKIEAGRISLEEVERIGTIDQFPASILAKAEFKDREITVTSFPDFLEVLKAYRTGTIDAVTLPEPFFNSDSGLCQHWQSIHRFKGNAEVLIIASPLVTAEQLATFQQISSQKKPGHLDAEGTARPGHPPLLRHSPCARE